jgi:threonine synthase
VYACPTCGGLLEVHHELEPLRRRSAEGWMALLEERAARPLTSGVWAMQEWVIPSLEAANIVSLAEGNSNLFDAAQLGRRIGAPNLWVKLCGNSHTGSFKDLGMTVLVSVVKQMIAAGRPIQAVACASTGDTSAALAAYAAAAGIPAIVFLPHNKVSAAQLIQPIANGAHVLALETDFDGCMRLVREVTRDNRIYLANSLNSLRIEGQKTVAIEIVRQMGWEPPDWIIIPVGNLGNISALYKGLKLLLDLGVIHKMPRLAAAQAANANPFYQSYRAGFARKVTMPARDTQASAIRIGDPVSYPKAVQAVQATNGLVAQAGRAGAGARRGPGGPKPACTPARIRPLPWPCSSSLPNRASSAVGSVSLSSALPTALSSRASRSNTTKGGCRRWRASTPILPSPSPPTPDWCVRRWPRGCRRAREAD